MTPTPAPTPPTFQPADPTTVPAPGLDPSSGDWWWQYGLDGIVGGLVGGFVTGLAVWFTIRHERRLTARAELRTAVAALQGMVLDMSWNLPKRWVDDLDDDASEVQEIEAKTRSTVELTEWTVKLFAAITVVAALATEIAPRLSRDLVSSTDWLQDQVLVQRSDVYDPEVPSRWAGVLHARLYTWLANSRTYERNLGAPDWSAGWRSRIGSAAASVTHPVDD